MSVTGVGKPAVGVELAAGDIGLADATEPGGTAAGINVPFTFGLLGASDNGAGDAAKGLESLTSRITFDVQLPADAKPAGCSGDNDIRSANHSCALQR